MIKDTSSTPKLDKADGAAIVNNIPSLNGSNSVHFELMKSTFLLGHEHFVTNMALKVAPGNGLGLGRSPLGNNIGKGGSASADNTFLENVIFINYGSAPLYKRPILSRSKMWEEGKPFKVAVNGVGPCFGTS